MQPRDLYASRRSSASLSPWKAGGVLLLLGGVLWLCHPSQPAKAPAPDADEASDTTPDVLLTPKQQPEPAVSSPSPPPPPAPVVKLQYRASCGDGRCDPDAGETISSCGADCPGVTTPEQCGEEPHSDPGGHAVVWGASHKVATAAECCQRCSEHAANPRNAKKPCNSWVFCYTYPQCWALDTGNWHGFGECWLKWQADPSHPLYGQRGAYSAEFRKKHWRAHLVGRNPDGTPRNLTVPTHVPWTGGIMGVRVDHSIKWETGLDGMKSSAGAAVVMWRAWESKEMNLARGVPCEQMGLPAGCNKKEG